jgi:hypothetical protein
MSNRISTLELSDKPIIDGERLGAAVVGAVNDEAGFWLHRAA